jgi:hypothetical protein
MHFVLYSRMGSDQGSRGSGILLAWGHEFGQAEPEPDEADLRRGVSSPSLFPK